MPKQSGESRNPVSLYFVSLARLPQFLEVHGIMSVNRRPQVPKEWHHYVCIPPIDFLDHECSLCYGDLHC